MEIKLKLLSFFVFVPLILGCAGSPMSISTMSPEELKNVKDKDLCAAYGMERKEKLKTEMERRTLLTDDEWKLVEKKQIEVGMSICALFASWGPPNRQQKFSGSWGIHIQYIYGSYSESGTPTFVNTENGSVTSWHD